MKHLHTVLITETLDKHNKEPIARPLFRKGCRRVCEGDANSNYVISGHPVVAAKPLIDFSEKGKSKDTNRKLQE